MKTNSLLHPDPGCRGDKDSTGYRLHLFDPENKDGTDNTDFRRHHADRESKGCRDSTGCHHYPIDQESKGYRDSTVHRIRLSGQECRGCRDSNSPWNQNWRHFQSSRSLFSLLSCLCVCSVAWIQTLESFTRQCNRPDWHRNLQKRLIHRIYSYIIHYTSSGKKSQQSKPNLATFSGKTRLAQDV